MLFNERLQKQYLEMFPTLVVQVFYLYLWHNTKKWTCCIVLLLYEGMTHKFFGTYLAMQMFVPKTVL